MSILKKSMIVAASAAMAFASSATAVLAEGEEETTAPEPTEEVTDVKAAFLADLNEDGYAELDAWKVEKIRGNVYHMDEATKALPGGATDEAGNLNNPSSIYFVVEENELLIVDAGNPLTAGSDKEAAAKAIVEAMAGEKEVSFAFSHGHIDHIGLLEDQTVMENINLKKVYIGEQDLIDKPETSVYGARMTKWLPEGIIQGIDEGSEFTIGETTYEVIGIHAHTEGSVAIVDKANEIVFTGDSIGSGFVWIFWNEGTNPLGTLEEGVTKLQGVVGQMSSPRILAGHRWQQFWENNAQRPNEMSIQYLNDMNAVLGGLATGTTLKEDYTLRTGLELSANGCKAKVDTTPELIEEYLEGKNSYTAAENVWVYSKADTLSIETENNTQAAKFMIFTDTAVTKEEGQKLLEETGLLDVITKSASMAIVQGPQGETWTDEDVDVTIAILNDKVGPTTNLNFIGIGAGATYMNQKLSDKMYGVSGVMSYGGEAGPTPKYSVPAYVSNSGEGTAEAYKAANNATASTTAGTITTSVNPECRFEVVVENSAEETAVEAIKNAWTEVFSKFGRIGNIAESGVGTWYWNPNTIEKPYQLIDSVDCIDNIERTIYTEDLNGSGTDSLWYVYVPEEVKGAEAGTVPVVFLMHGNTNDPRTQYDTSGWAQIASREGIILVCPEWQGHTYQGYTYEPMTNDANQTPNSDFIKCVDRVLEDFPQADASRLYISGLSAGCRNTSNNAFSNTGVFAAGAGQSGPFKYNDASLAVLQESIDANKEKYDMPIIYFAGDRDEYLGDWDILSGSGGEQIAKMFAEMNEMELETGVEDYSKLYGVKWTVYSEDVENEGLCTIIGGTVENAKGVEISMNRICNWGHWNYPADAQLMWDFVKKYARDPETGATIRLDKQEEPEVKPEPEKPADKPEEGKKPTTGVNTGDSFNGGILGGLVLAAIALAVAAFRAVRKH